MCRMLITAITCVGFLVLIVLGCSAVQKPLGSMTLVETSGDKPGWLEVVPERDGGQLYWVGRRSEADSEDGALADAREDCAKQLADYLAKRVTRLYESMRGERNVTHDLGPLRLYVNDAYKSWVRKAATQGLKTRETYWERYEKLTGPERVRYLYKGYALMKVGKRTLTALGSEAFSEQLAEARRKGDQAAERELKNLMRKIDELDGPIPKAPGGN